MSPSGSRRQQLLDGLALGQPGGQQTSQEGLVHVLLYKVVDAPREPEGLIVFSRAQAG